MSGRQAVVQMCFRVIAPEEFRNRTRNGEPEQIHGEHLAIKLAATEQPFEREEQPEIH